MAVNRDARETITDPLLVDELITDEAVTLLYSSRPDEALLALSAMSDHPTARSRVLRSITESPALLATGRCETVLDLIDDAHEAHRRLEDSSAIAHPGIHVVYKVKALLDAGRLTEGRELAQLGYDQARRGGPPLGRTWFLIGLGRAALLAGQPRTARRWLAEGIVASSGSGFDGPHRLQLSFLATAQAWLGDVEGATSSLAELDATPPAAFFEAEHDLGRAWLAAVTGDPVRARSVLAAAADRAGERGERASEIWLLHHLVRLGEVVGPASRLTALEERCEGALVAVYAEHARALASGDPAGLDRVAARFAELGAWLAGAEAANAAADAHRRNQDQRGGQRVARCVTFAGGPLRGSEHARPPHGIHRGTADRSGAGGRHARRCRPVEPRHRCPSLPVSTDGREPPPERLHEARREQPLGAGPGAARHPHRSSPCCSSPASIASAVRP